MNDIIKHTPQDIIPERLFIQAGYDSLSPATRKAYENDLNAFYRIIGKDLTDVTALDIPAYIDALEKAGLKNSTINRKLYSLSKVFKLYQVVGMIDKNPVAELNKVKKITRAVSKQIDAQIELADVQAVIAAGSRTAVIINTLANTGLRISELINIKPGDIENHRTGGKTYKRVRIVGKRKKERFIYLSGELYQDIKRTFTGESEYLFHSEAGRILNRVNLHKQIKQTFRAYTDKDVHPHSLRHFFATHKIKIEKQDIKAVSKYLGHSGTAITLDMYVDTALSAENSMIIN
jgi:site-specific recombinase XerD